VPDIGRKPVPEILTWNLETGAGEGGRS